MINGVLIFKVVCVTGSLHILEKKWTYASQIRSHVTPSQQQQNNSHPVCRTQNIWTWGQGSCKRPQETRPDDTQWWENQFCLHNWQDTHEKKQEKIVSLFYGVVILCGFALLMESLVSCERRRNEHEHNLTLNLYDATDTESLSPSDQQPEDKHQYHSHDNRCSDSHCDWRPTAFFSRADERKRNSSETSALPQYIQTMTSKTETNTDDSHL